MELDDAYANAPHIPGADAYPERWSSQAAAFRDTLTRRGRAELGIAYADGPRCAYDLFLPEGAPGGLCVFVHGGYWLRFDRSFWSHLAAGPVARGWAVMMPSYDLCPAVRIPDITQQIAQAVRAAAARVAGPVALAGHSAGGHLVARMGAPAMLPRAVAERIAHIMPISPVSDLRPLMQTAMNADFHLTEATARAESPVLHPAPAAPVTVWVGANERPVFLDQARWLAEAWGASHVIEGSKHHFDVIDGLADPASRMIGALLP
ncbi:alpha/beta hydrolase [Roseovarius spongiae]|uniref:Alpha/beta hydrolase n=1 Tax=Roseovarius spongiae TaxID=2320272 RepID=A0A3A8BAH0_9RHOB|nr:alpha/beta hydrolase [Roseovarius spongiae]RKF16124.1 alpha/beta hydrolase [Roseovarius spongiae]